MKYILLNDDNTVQGKTQYKPGGTQKYTTDPKVWSKHVEDLKHYKDQTEVKLDKKIKAMDKRIARVEETLNEYADTINGLRG